MVFRFIARWRKGKKKILIIKIDEIGDYILIRNFFEEVKKSTKYAGYEIDLLGNETWKNIASNFDHSCISRQYFFKTSNAYNNPYQILKLGWKLFKNNYETVLQPTSTRRLLNDGLAALTAAKNIIGFLGNNDGIYPKYKRKTDLFYTEMLTLPDRINFEFYRNQYFFEKVLGESIGIQAPSINVSQSKNRGHILLFSGAGIVNRCWPLQNFIEICRMLIAQTVYDVVLCGGKGELEDAKIICSQLSSARIHNSVGSTTLPETLQLIADARLVICNETSALHMSAACNTPVVCIVGGGHFNRFVPYPSQIQNKIKYVYKEMPCYQCNWNCIYQVKKSEAFPCINVISVNQVWEEISDALEEN